VSRLAAAVLVALALAGCDEEEPAPPPVRPVLSTVLLPQAEGGQTFTGVVEPRYEAALSFRLLGRILARDVDIGDQVDRGQRLAAIDPVTQELAVRSARAEVSNAAAQFETATATEARQQQLRDQDVVSAADFEAAEQAREAAQATVSRAQANLVIAEEQLAYTRIVAEFDGVVTAVGADVGQVVSPGEMVVTVARPDEREAVIDVPAELVSFASSGTRFNVSLELDPSVRTTGAVREVAPQADPVSRTQRIWLSLQDPPPSFRLGTTVRAVVAADVVPGLAAPRTAILERDGTTMVWVVDPDALTVDPVEVTVAELDASRVLVVGIEPGTRIVTAGVNRLEPGQAVRLLHGAAS
jgi:RND family efflux transporter MFP subunit